MIQLERHIEILLLENECVIVPDFGGFMTHHVSARYDEADCMFLPPHRTLGFNPQLRINDSVLAQSYVEAYDISYPEALRRIRTEVKELQQQLQEWGSYEMKNLGILTINQEGNYEFAPCEAGVLSPDIYGLGNFTFKHLKDDTLIKPTVDLPQTTKMQEEQEVIPQDASLLDFTDDNQEIPDEKAIVIKMAWIRNAVAVAAAVVAFFLISTPIANSDLQHQSISQLQHNILYKLIPQDTDIIPAEPVTKEVLPAPTQSPDTTKATPPVAVSKKQTTYMIIVASQVKMSNAESLVNKLQQQGFKDAKVFVRNKIVRVSCGEYSTQEEAYRQLNKINGKEEFWEAWVYKNKTEV